MQNDNQKPWRRLWLAGFVVAAGLLWYLVFRTTGLMWWNAPDLYDRRQEPPPPLFTPLPTFDGVDPKIQHLPQEQSPAEASANSAN